MGNPATVPMFAPDGSTGDIPIDKVSAAQQAGFKRAYEMTSPDGKTGYIPEGQQAAAMAKGFLMAGQPSEANQSHAGYWDGLKAGVEGMWNAVRHPIDTITQQGSQILAGGVTPYGTPLIASTGNKQIDEQNQQMQQQARAQQADQGRFMAEHPAYTAGMFTPAAALTAAGAAEPYITKAIGRAALLGKTPEGAYESALKPSTNLPPVKREAIIQTGLKQGIPISKNGLEQLGDKIDNLNQAIKDEISKDPNRPIDPQAVATRANQVIPRFGEQVNAGQDLNAIEASKQQFLAEQGAKPGTPAIPPRPTGLLDAQGNPIMSAGTPAQSPQPAPPMAAAAAQKMKQGTYIVLGGKYGEQGSATVEAQKALARGLKEEIANQFPEISDLNAQESKLLDLQPVLERAVNRISNHQLIGIGTPVAGAAAKAVTGSGSVGIVASALKSVLDNPTVKSRLAIAVSKGGRIPYAQALARVGAYASALEAAQSAGESSGNSAQSPNQ